MAMNGKLVLDTDWTGAGHPPPLATINEIKSIAENMEYQSGRKENIKHGFIESGE